MFCFLIRNQGAEHGQQRQHTYNAAEDIRTQSHTLTKSFVLREIRRACFVLLPHLPLGIPNLG